MSCEKEMMTTKHFQMSWISHLTSIQTSVPLTLGCEWLAATSIRRWQGLQTSLQRLENISTNMEQTCSFDWKAVVCLSAGVLSFQFYGVLVRPTDTVSLSLAEPGPTADSGFYLMWTSRVGFQCRLQHTISIMTRGGTSAAGWLVTLGRQERGARKGEMAREEGEMLR